MKYFIFDMDETIAELYSVYYFLASLRMRELLSDNSSRTTLSRGLENKLNIAYDVFVDRVTKEEQSDMPLGILRPGILKIMQDLKRLQRKGIIQRVAIYSNNGHLESLELIRDIVHKSTNSSVFDPLIGDCIHWDHPLRGPERLREQGAANKTWSILKRILTSGPCGAPETIEPKDVYFFDDLKHEKMEETHYYQVPPYTTKASFDRIEDIYIDGLVAAKLSDQEKQEFYRLISRELLGLKESHLSLNDVLHDFWQKTKGTVAPHIQLTSEGDKGIALMKEAILKVVQDSPLTGGKRPIKERSFRKTRRAKRRRLHKSMRHAGMKRS